MEPSQKDSEKCSTENPVLSNRVGIAITATIVFAVFAFLIGLLGSASTIIFLFSFPTFYKIVSVQYNQLLKLLGHDKSLK